MNVILLGPPGAGKGTQSKLIEDRYHLKQLSSGDMLRRAVSERTEAGLRAKTYMDAGQLVPDEVVVDAVLDAIASLPPERPGIILDGFPRTVQQAQALDAFMQQRGEAIDWAIVIDVSDDRLVERIAGRFTCANCGEGYHDSFKRPRAGGVCDRCGGTKFKRRSDDDPEVVRQRLEVYHRDTKPLIDYYRAKGRLRVIDGELPIGEVTERIDEILSPQKADAAASSA
jgi:adenylate kinase